MGELVNCLNTISVSC